MKLPGLLFMLLLTAITASAILSAVSADEIIGVWTTGNGDARVEVYKKQSKYFGKIVWLKEPIDPETNQPKKDQKNPDKAKQNQPIKGLEILQDFKWDAADSEWDDGTIYDPKSGKTYSCYITLEDANTLKVRGYVGVSWLGRTDTWTRSR